eukprot:c14838_g1_i2 orf=264-1211(-)
MASANNMIAPFSQLVLTERNNRRELRGDCFSRSFTTTAAAHLCFSSHGSTRKRPLLPIASMLQDATPLNRSLPVSTPEVDRMLDTIKWDKNGLVVAIAQHINTGAILMQGFANADAISATIASGKATFYSRSRSSLWTKGETSSNFINVKDVFLDCDRDSIIYLGLPDGPTCHTGSETCYFTPALRASKDNQNLVESQNTFERIALTTLLSLEDTISKRKAELSEQSVSGWKPSWTQRLLKDHSLLCSKIREEADELCRTLESNEGKDRAASEMADVLYHSMVLLAVQDVKVEDVLEVLRKRFSQSGIEEKNSRK